MGFTSVGNITNISVNGNDVDFKANADSFTLGNAVVKTASSPNGNVYNETDLSTQVGSFKFTLVLGETTIQDVQTWILNKSSNTIKAKFVQDNDEQFTITYANMTLANQPELATGTKNEIPCEFTGSKPTIS